MDNHVGEKLAAVLGATMSYNYSNNSSPVHDTVVGVLQQISYAVLSLSSSQQTLQGSLHDIAISLSNLVPNMNASRACAHVATEEVGRLTKELELVRAHNAKQSAQLAYVHDILENGGPDVLVVGKLRDMLKE